MSPYVLLILCLLAIFLLCTVLSLKMPILRIFGLRPECGRLLPTYLPCSLWAIALLRSLTLTKAEAYHNMIWAMASRGVPVGAVGVQALFDCEI